VIVPVWNARRFLPGFLESLKAQTLPPAQFELIVADDGSTDGSIEYAESSDQVAKVLRGHRSNAYAARNRAVVHSRGDVLAFIDADCLPDPDWLERGLEAASSADIVAGGIDFSFPKDYTLWSLLDAETTKNHAVQVQTNNAETANMFVLRSAFDAVGGFDETEPGHGDFDFVERCVEIGKVLAYEPLARVTHPTRDEARPFLWNVWEMHRSYGARQARAGRRPDRFKLRTWLPLVSPLRARRRFGHPIRLNRQRLESGGVTPSIGKEVLTLGWLYLGLPYFQGCAQLYGWWTQRRADSRMLLID
jgi:glycosyltransferase involved in cell wall biosynthesis